MLNVINGETLFISDTHLGHNNILKHCKTRNVDMQKKKMINHDKWIKDNWNSVVKQEQPIIHCGDLSYKGRNDVISGLNGVKYLLKGNHDDLKELDYSNNGFEIIKTQIFIKEFQNDIVLLKKIKDYVQSTRFFNFILFEFDGLRFLVSHFPIVDTQGYDAKYSNQINGLKEIFEYCKCDYNLHGHTHENTMNDKRCINISFEKIGFKPITLNDIIKKIKLQEILNKK